MEENKATRENVFFTKAFTVTASFKQNPSLYYVAYQVHHNGAIGPKFSLRITPIGPGGMELSKELHCKEINMRDDTFYINFASPDGASIGLDFTMYSFELCCLSKNLFKCRAIYKDKGSVVDNVVLMSTTFSCFPIDGPDGILTTFPFHSTS